MSKVFLFFAVIISNLVFAQKVMLTKVSNTVTSSDNILMNFSSKVEGSIDLGEIEIIGAFSNIDKAYHLVYSKAKDIGANYYVVDYDNSIEGDKSFSRDHFIIKLYYITDIKDHVRDKSIYIFNIGKDMTININGDKRLIKKNSFLAVPVELKDYIISTRKFLGSTIKFQPSGVENYYFSVTNGRTSTREASSDGFLSIKSGDILGVTASFGEFLKVLLKEMK